MKLRKMFTLGVGWMLAAVLTAGAQDNLLTNPDFEAGNADPFTAYGDITLSIDNTEVHGGDNALFVDVNSVPANPWDSGIKYTQDVAFTQGTEYTWALFMKGEAPRVVNMKPELDADPFTGYGETAQNITTDWEEYHVTFTPDANVAPASLTLHTGASDIGFWVDDVRFYEGPFTPGDDPTAVDAKGKLATSWASLKKR